jgi:hypothetical protein
MRPLRSLVDRRRLKQARRAVAKDPSRVVCATLAHDGRPIYFTAAVDAHPVDMAFMAFEQREGRPASTFERRMLQVAATRRALSDRQS